LQEVLQVPAEVGLILVAEPKFEGGLGRPPWGSVHLEFQINPITVLTDV
jgi:hypothetical protein